MSRKRQLKELKKNILIFCEGQTEALYFKMLNQKYKAGLTVNVHPFSRDGKQGDTLIKDLIHQQKSNPQLKGIQYELIFAIFDKDDLPDHNIIHAHQLAQANGITIIFSNECFDLWLLKHYEKVMGHKNRVAIYKRLSTLLKLPKNYETYKADKEFIEKYFRDYVHIAMQNTTHLLEKKVHNAVPSNPYTNIHIYLEKIYNRNSTSSGW